MAYDKKIWTVTFKNGALPPTNVAANDEEEAVFEAVALVRYHAGMVDFRPADKIVERIEPADQADSFAKWNSRPVVEKNIAERMF